MPRSHYPWMQQGQQPPSKEELTGKKFKKSKTSKKGKDSSEQSDSGKKSRQSSAAGRPKSNAANSRSQKTQREADRISNGSRRSLSPADSRGSSPPTSYPLTLRAPYDDRDERKATFPHPVTNPSSQDGQYENMPLHHLIYNSSVHGRSQMIKLNERLVSFLKQNSNGPGSDTSHFRKLLESLQADLDRIRSETDREVSLYKNTIEKTAGEYADILSKHKSLTVEKEDWERRWHDEHQRFLELELKTISLQKKIIELETQKANLESKMSDLESKGFVSDEDRYSNLLQRYEQTERRYCEEKKRTEYLQEIQNAEKEKHKSAKESWEKQIRLLKETLDQIEKNSNTNPEMDFTALLEEIRETCSKEMNNHHTKTEDALHQSLHKLQDEMKESSLQIDKLQTENRELKEQIGDLKSDLHKKELEVKHLEERNEDIKKEFSQERLSHQQKVKDLEERSSNFYRQYLEKTRECTEARETQIALQTEINSYQALLDAEEQKVKHSSADGQLVKEKPDK